jgi:hypothetical protein
MTNRLQVADSLVLAMRDGRRCEPADLSAATTIALDASPGSGEGQVLASVLREAIRRTEEARRSGADVSAEVVAFIRGLPSDVLEGVRRPGEWSMLWGLLHDHAVRRCRSSADRGMALLAEFASALGDGRGGARPLPQRRRRAGWPLLAGDAVGRDAGQHCGMERFRGPVRPGEAGGA